MLPPGSKAPAIVQAARYARNPLGFLSGEQRRFGDIFSVRFPFFGRVVYVARPDLVKAVFTGSPSDFHAGEANATVLEPALGPNSVLTLDDEPHMRQRKLLLPPFHGERVERYGELIVEMTRREMESWPVGEPFALRPHTQRITLAVIMRAVFGVHDEQRLRRFERLIDDFARRVTDTERRAKLTAGLGSLLANSASSMLQLRMLVARRFGGPSPLERLQALKRQIDALLFEEIAERRGDPREDILSLLVTARFEDGEPMDDQEIRDQLLTLLLAGHETTATGLAWAVERLVRNPAVLAKLRDSLAAGEEEYLNATVKETLRARPVIVDVARKLKAPATIGGYELPEGQFVLPAIAALHYREDLFPEPEEFRPERFLGGQADNYAWIPFGGGIRRCIGAAFAEYEMRTILREFVERAELRAVASEPERVKVRNITLAPAHGTRVVLERPLT